MAERSADARGSRVSVSADAAFCRWSRSWFTCDSSCWTRTADRFSPVLLRKPTTPSVRDRVSAVATAWSRSTTDRSKTFELPSRLTSISSAVNRGSRPLTPALARAFWTIAALVATPLTRLRSASASVSEPGSEVPASIRAHAA